MNATFGQTFNWSQVKGIFRLKYKLLNICLFVIIRFDSAWMPIISELDLMNKLDSYFIFGHCLGRHFSTSLHINIDILYLFFNVKCFISGFTFQWRQNSRLFYDEWNEWTKSVEMNKIGSRSTVYLIHDTVRHGLNLFTQSIWA